MSYQNLFGESDLPPTEKTFGSEESKNIEFAICNEQSGFRPFSNGTDADIWESRNCSNCALKLFNPVLYEEKNLPTSHLVEGYEEDETGKTNLNCVGYFAISCGYANGFIPNIAAEWIGGENYENGFSNCQKMLKK